MKIMGDHEEEDVINWILHNQDDKELHQRHQLTDDIEFVSIERPRPSFSSQEVNNIVATDESDPGSNTGKDILRSKKSSAASQYFEKETEVTARCTLCIQVCKHSGNTTNLMQHLNRKHALFCSVAVNTKRKRDTASESSTEAESADDSIHPVKKIKFQSKGKLTSIKEAFERTKSFKEGGKTYDNLTNAILYMIAIDKMPYSTVENEGFRMVMKTAVPLYTMPSRKTVTGLLDARYVTLKERFVARLAKSVSYSLTCDNWTDVTFQSYLGVTVHYITEDIQMENGCVGVFPLDESHTAQYLKETLNAITKDFGLDHAKITAVVTDSAAHIKKAVRDLLGQDKHLACFAHTLSHLVPSALASMPIVRATIAKVKTIVTLTRRSVAASDELKKLQIRDGKTAATALKYIQDVTTRWNSTLYMLERFLLLEQYVYPVTSKCSNKPDMLKREVIQMLKDVVCLMKPVECIIKTVSGDSYPTCSVIIPIVHCLEDAIRRYNPSTKYGVEFKEKLQTEIAGRFEAFERNKILAMSTILDPRFKRLQFQSALAASSAISDINDKISTSVVLRTEIVDNVAPDEPSDADNIWSYHDRLVASTTRTVTGAQNDGLCLELRQYLNQQVIVRDSNPLQYWGSFKLAFPSLYEIAVKYVSIVGTSVPSERLFSQAGDIKTDNRSRLSGEHLNKLMFLGSLARKDWGLE